MSKIEKMAKSLNTVINKTGYDGTEIKSTEVTLADGNKFNVEYIQLTGDGVFLSDAEGEVLHPFASIGSEADAEAIYNIALEALTA